MRLLGREALRSWAETRVEATERDIRQRPQMIAKMRRTPLAYGFRRDRGPGAAISVRDPAGASFCARSEGDPAWIFRVRCSAPSSTSPSINPSPKRGPTCRSTTAPRSARARSNGSSSPTPRPCSKLVARALNFRRRRASASRSSSRRTAAWFRSSSLVSRGKTRARRCPGGRRSCCWRTLKGAGRRFMRARLRAGSRGWASAAFLRGSRRLQGGLTGSRGRRRRAWSVGQIEEQFGDHGCYLIDFYHVCEYLAAASEAIAPDPGAPGWRGRRRGSKGGRLAAVLRALVGCCEPLRSQRPTCARAILSPLSQRSRQPPELPSSFGRRAATRLGRDRKRSSPRCATTPQAARRLVARRACRIQAHLCG